MLSAMLFFNEERCWGGKGRGTEHRVGVGRGNNESIHTAGSTRSREHTHSRVNMCFPRDSHQDSDFNITHSVPILN